MVPSAINVDTQWCEKVGVLFGGKSFVLMLFKERLSVKLSARLPHLMGR